MAAGTKEAMTARGEAAAAAPGVATGAGVGTVRRPADTTWGQPPQEKDTKSGLFPIEMRIFAFGFTRDCQLRNALW